MTPVHLQKEIDKLLLMDFGIQPLDLLGTEFQPEQSTLESVSICLKCAGSAPMVAKKLKGIIAIHANGQDVFGDVKWIPNEKDPCRGKLRAKLFRRTNQPYQLKEFAIQP